MRRLPASVQLSALLLAEAAAVGALHRLGGVPGLGLPDLPLGSWLAAAAPGDVVAAALRLAGLAVGWWLLATTLLAVLARLTRVPALIVAADLTVLPGVRRLADRGVAVALTTTMTLAGSPAFADVLVPPGAEGPLRPAPEVVDPAPDGAAQRGAERLVGPPPDAGLAPDPSPPLDVPPEERPSEGSPAEDDLSATAPPALPAPPVAGAIPTQGPDVGEDAADAAVPSTATPATPSRTSEAAPEPLVSSDVPRPVTAPAEDAISGSPLSRRSDGPAAADGWAHRMPGPAPAGTAAPERGSAEAEEVPPSVARHRVLPGQHLWAIAEATVATAQGRPAGRASLVDVAAYWRRLVRANAPALRSGDPDLVHPGEVLVLPPVEAP